ncbi:peptide-methionine (S)-S-oxide reductase [Lottiidibacillus patelloidae]|uniref:Peptide methionine sulfoxide reductase MsrA n=1 Tax=Lottiidibacillus patelloidae TaxID=2670334 RepID=A0A263BR96_9BACI|nr:peptide-methionine (S)-S-oxide reductase MsrA [Lottiidibacillus patelloidae]OZM56225.1 peptide-methionine (S)-S-oxide reductase [Lottiidibacillus patelloidae]
MGKFEIATFGAGCFWEVEFFLKQINGVQSTEVGYLGGNYDNPTYEMVKKGVTGHAEVVQVVFDPTLVTYSDLLNVFWDNHNPTTLNRQGDDVGTQYRSAIFYHSAEQQFVAQASKLALEQSKRFSKPIVTEITPVSTFYRAEEYHQNYFEKNGLSSCQI